MLTFTKWVLRENQANNITIDLSEYDERIKKAIAKISDYSANHAEEVGKMQFNPAMIANSNYPQKQALLAALQNHTPDTEEHLDDLVSHLGHWVMDANRQKYDPNNRALWTHVMNYQSQLNNNYQHDPKAYEQSYQNLIAETTKNMEAIKLKVIEAIQGIPNWNGSPIRLVPQSGEDVTGNTYTESGANDCQIFVGTRHGMFSFFQDDETGKIMIDDVVEGGYEDEEFFDNDQVKADYYALINELRSPGINNKGKILTLFTARPTKDRDFFTNATYLPINLFLTNSADHADGLAHDLGAREVRDVWKVRIDSRYLTQTLDGPVKYYMVSQDKAPIKSISMY
jgi:effector-binding domain-containing protein